MGMRIQGGLRLAKIAIAGFLAGKAVTGLAEWMRSNLKPISGRTSSDLRGVRTGHEVIRTHLKGLRKRTQESPRRGL